eukprot:5549114-Amphidinium_carterae.1
MIAGASSLSGSTSYYPEPAVGHQRFVLGQSVGDREERVGLSGAEGHSYGPLLPVAEHVVFTYLGDGADSLALTSLGLVPGCILGLSWTHLSDIFDVAVEASKSARVRGMATQVAKRKRVRRQVRPLIVAAVRALEYATVHSHSRSDCIMAGFFTFMTLVRARYDDVTMCFKAEMDMAHNEESGYVELATRHVKQDAALGRQGDELHLVGHAFGVTSVAWASTWVDDLRAEGLIPTVFPSIWRAPTRRATRHPTLQPVLPCERCSYVVAFVLQRLAHTQCTVARRPHIHGARKLNWN